MPGDRARVVLATLIAVDGFAAFLLFGWLAALPFGVAFAAAATTTAPTPTRTIEGSQ